MIARIVLGLTVLVASMVASVSAASAADAINGRWITEDRDAVIEIKQCGATTSGRIARFLVTPPDGLDQRDINNPNTRLRQRKLLGLPILTQFKEEETLWRGQIYDPNTGKSYRSVIRRKGPNVLEVKGCIGPFCQTQVWRKAR